MRSRKNKKLKKIKKYKNYRIIKRQRGGRTSKMVMALLPELFL